ncbi:amino acid ABC transporter ATP-binding protein [Bordetella trematum]|uniref:amino acid ABC transporter ATP-binding protein n=1 Tax=Bordetella trematum TaxID=123899 RepID=UPI000D8B4FEA|nr:amino acid ABC transporter ATP-binding protein [Bordetella trematum]SPU50158.1 amino-acid ABC transporter ATP-binding protein [Bordetella trematum]VDH07894.1 Probable amino-acid import ATP-binding protein YxeO [Bordetella trematum]
MIVLRDIDKAFDGHPVLRGLNLRVEEGSVTALIGPSGSGKSTLLRCVNLLEVPDRGELRIAAASHVFDGGPVPRQALRALRGQTGMVFQNFQLFAHRTALQNVMEGLVTVLKWPVPRARERAMDLLEKVGMAAKADAWPGTLSGGQQQRVAIARALAPAPRVLLCDEPTSALDPSLAVEVLAVLRELAAEGMTMIMATHDLRLAASVAQQVVFLQDGKIVEAGTPQALFTAPHDPRTRDFVATLNQGLPPEWGSPS